jgi:tetratricopeptide (TPR) repeat protein
LSTYNELNGEIFKAILNLDKALTYLGDEDNKNKSVLYNNLSLLYKNLNYYEKAEYYIEKAISITNESEIQLNTLNSLASIKMRLNKLEESEKVYRKIIEKSKNDNNQRTPAQVYTNLGNVSRRKKEFEKALDYYHKSDSICDSLGVEIGKYINQINRSEVYLDMGQYKEAEKTILVAKNKSEDFDIPSINVELYKLLSEILAKNNQTALSDRYFRMYTELKEKLSGDQTKSSINELELAKERENNLPLKSEMKLKMERQKTQFYFIGLVLITLVMLVMGVYMIRKKRG